MSSISIAASSRTLLSDYSFLMQRPACCSLPLSTEACLHYDVINLADGLKYRATTTPPVASLAACSRRNARIDKSHARVVLELKEPQLNLLLSNVSGDAPRLWPALAWSGLGLA